MAGEHNTPVGTPVLLAPGKVFLVGEYAVLNEGSAVVAAIARHARAQFIPRMETMPPLVSEVVKRARIHLGEVAAALPPGAVLVTTNDFQLDCPSGGLGSSAAIAVAAAASVYETLGLDLGERKAEILAVAGAGRRVAQGDVGSGADTTVATYGGMVEVVRCKDAPPTLRNLTAPPELDLVLFTAGRSSSTTEVSAALAAYAEQDPSAFSNATQALQDIARRFVEQIDARNAKGAVEAAGAYGDEIAKLALAAGVSVGNEAFARAGKLARQYGGMAKPIGAGSGHLGLALFANPDAAKAFRRACPAPIVPIAGGLELDGVRCQTFLSGSDASESTLTPSPDEGQDDFEDDAATVIQTFDPALMATAIPAKDTVSASAIEVQTTNVTTKLPIQRRARRTPRQLAIFGIALLAACLVVAWLGFAKQSSRGRIAPVRAATALPTPATAPVVAEPANAAPPPAQAMPAPAAPEPPIHVEAPSPSPAGPTADLAPPRPEQLPAKPTARSERRERRARTAHVSNAQARAPRSQEEPGVRAAPPARAGTLSPSDF